MSIIQLTVGKSLFSIYLLCLATLFWVYEWLNKFVDVVIGILYEFYFFIKLQGNI
jgi:hypothetical protein